MPKPILNNRNNKASIGGIVSNFDTYVNQAVTTNSSPTFGNLYISGDTLINGNLYVEGNTTVIDSLVSQFSDNIILLNNNELGPGVTLLQAGIEIDRGSNENYRIVYNETSNTFRVGPISSTKPVAIREDNPLNNGIMVWNNSSNLVESVNQLNLSVSISDTTNCASVTSGSLWTKGGVGIGKDMFINGKINMNGNILQSNTANSLSVASPGDINFVPSGIISIPDSIPLIFGTTNQSVSYNAGSSTLKIKSGGSISYEFVTGSDHYISIPNGVPLTFSTANEKIYTDNSNNMVIAGSKDILLNPGSSAYKVIIPVNTPLVFNNVNQSISANAGGDLSIVAGNNILLNPSVSGGYIRIPTDNKLKLGATGNQSLSSDSSNNININANSNINITTANVVLSNNSTIGWDYQKLSRDTSGNLLMNAGTSGNVIISNTHATSALTVCGGVQVDKTVTVNKGIVLNSTSGSFVVTNNGNVSSSSGNSTSNIVDIDLSKSIPHVIINGGDGLGDSGTGSSLVISSLTNDAKNLLEIKSNSDTVGSYYIGRDNASGSRNFNINIPSYNQYNNIGDIPTFTITTDNTTTRLLDLETDTGHLNIYGSLILHNTQDSVNTTTGSFVLYGGLSVAKNIYTNGTFTCITSSINAVTIKQSETSGTLLSIDTTDDNIDITANRFNVNNSFMVKGDTTNDTTASLVITSDNSVNINKVLRVNEQAEFNNTIDINHNYIINVPDPIDANDVANKGYVDLVKQGLFVKDSVKVGTTEPLNLSNGFVAGLVIDSYTLVVGDRILIKDQSNPVENGIYIIKSSGAPTRAIDFAVDEHASGSFMFIENGSNNANSGWICNTTSSDIIGTDPLTFTQFNGVGLLVGGDAIYKNVNVINVKVDDYTIEIDNVSNSLRSSSKGLGTGLRGGSGSPLETSTDQSHINKVGNIINGTWSADNIGVPYGGTGQTQFNKGTILYGNDTGSLLSDYSFVFDEENIRLGVGINQPQSNLHISSVDSSVILIEADSDNSNMNAYPQLLFQSNNKDVGSVSISRNADDFYEGHYADAMIISNNFTTGGLSGSGGSIQFSTDKVSRMTILRNGYVGINNSTPTSALDVNGRVTLSDELLIYGNINIQNTGASSFYFGGSGSINGQLSLTNTNVAVNAESGGAIIIAGGASVGANMIIGDSLTVNGTTALNKLHFNSVTSGGGVGSGGSVVNYIQTPDNNDNAYSFSPIHVIRYTDYNNPIMSFLENGIKLNNNSSLCIGGNSGVAGGYTFNFDTTIGNLHITPYNTSVTNGCVIIGTNGNLSDLKLLGDNSNVYWSSKLDTLQLNDSILQLCNTLNNPKHVFSINSPDNDGRTVVKSVNDNGSFNTTGNLNIQMNTKFSNVSGGGLVSYIPGNTSSSFSFGEDVTVYFGGTNVFNGSLSFGNNGENVQLSNTTGSSSWTYMGILSNVQFDLYDKSYWLHVSASVNGSELLANHHYNNVPESGIVPVIYIYNDNDVMEPRYHAFINIPSNTSLSLNVSNNELPFSYSKEGYNVVPDGTVSGFNSGKWTLDYTTNTTGHGDHHLGNIFANDISISNNIPVVSYNNTGGSKDIGIALQRYQYTNDASLGDIVNDTPAFTLTLPSQVTMDLNRLKLTGGSLVDNYYTGWWVKCNTQVRKIVAYSGFQEIATIDADWTSQPQTGDIVYLYNNNNVCSYYNESDKRLHHGYVTNPHVDSTLTVNEYINVQMNDLYSNNVNASGTLRIYDTTDNVNSTDGGSLTVLGGASVAKTLLIGNKLGINNDSFFVPEERIHIKNSNTDSSVLLENNNTNGSYSSSISFKNNINYFKFSLDNASNLFKLSNNNGVLLAFNSSGSVSIGTETVISPLTIANGHLICTDNDNSYLGLNGGNSDSVNDGNAQLILNGSNKLSDPGNASIYLGGTSGNFNIKNGTSGNELLNMSNVGVVNIYNSTSSTIDNASLILKGGIAIQCTSNSASITSGGAMTVMGGMSVIKDLYIGGKVFIEGELNASGAVSQPEISFNNTTNCTIIEVGNVNLMRFSSQGILVFYINVTPTVSRDYCSFRFELPDRVSNLTNRGECVLNVSGWSNDTDIIPLFNVIGVGISGTKRCLVKFVSASTDIHYLTVQCIYTI